MTSVTSTLPMIAAVFLMIAVGIKQKRLTWKRRDPGWWRRRKPPTNGSGVIT
jgi:hypothetical protein